MSKRRFRKARKTEDSFYCPNYKGYEIDITRDDDNDLDGCEFSISVRNWEESFGAAYSGMWGNPGATIDDAIEQALSGSQL